MSWRTWVGFWLAVAVIGGLTLIGAFTIIHWVEVPHCRWWRCL